jgi:error-prone DNA polymerase
MSLTEEIAADYMVQGMSASHHPMEVFRPGISRDGVLRSSEIASLPSDTRVRVAGCVVCRQRPITAKGVVFITIEDEQGLVNVILRPQTYVKYRRIARMEPIIVVEGMLQKRDGIINIVAEHLLPLKDEQERQLSTYQASAPKARNFA